MRFPLSWLKECLPLDLSVKELSDTLTLGGIEVDSASKGEYSFSGVVVGLIEKAEVHPEQKRLKIATVFDGKERALVVCAASNCISGMKAPFAKVGAILEDEKGEKKMVKKEKLHRVDSAGMLCSEKELKLSDVGDRLMELSSDAPLGEELASYLSEVIFEVSLTPNLGHCLSIVGIARELAALLDQNIHLPKVEIKENGKESTQEAISVTIKDQKECPRYCLRQVKNVKIGPSPHWLKKRLEECGMRSINNVVDVTNFVMLEYGEPLHAFDASKLKTKKIIVAQTSKKLPFVSLDQIERVVPEETLMIWDGDKPIAIAGIIGGLNSEVDEKTTDIFLEAAHFTSELIRKGSKKMQLRSESSSRFERGVDPEILPKALDRAASLIQILAGGEISKGTIDTRKTALKPKVLLCHVKRVNQLLGTSLSLSEIETFFMRLGMKISQRTEENLHVSIPSYRNDIVSEIDLIEEIARIYGYNNIERSHPKVTLSALSHSPLYNIE
ncbi:MAG: phenylalanine--tRNA ligase subunit beta, partial [Simkania negevensis]|nr:phenylalanine--tRNA ligase subunit beta [Simkania negevensis]